MTRDEYQESVAKMRPVVATATVVLIVLLCYNVDGERRIKRIVGGVPAEVPPNSGTVPNPTSPTAQPPSAETEKPLVFVRKDRRSAVVRGIANEDGSYSFLGIRYAEPPIKRLRFQVFLIIYLKEKSGLNSHPVFSYKIGFSSNWKHLRILFRSFFKTIVFYGSWDSLFPTEAFP